MQPPLIDLPALKRRRLSFLPEPLDTSIIEFHDIPRFSIFIMAVLRFLSSSRPRYLPSLFALAIPRICRRRRRSSKYRSLTARLLPFAQGALFQPAFSVSTFKVASWGPNALRGSPTPGFPISQAALRIVRKNQTPPNPQEPLLRPRRFRGRWRPTPIGGRADWPPMRSMPNRSCSTAENLSASICPNRRGIYDRGKPRQQWLSHFSQHRQLAHELIIGQIIQRLHLDAHILGQNPSDHTDINVRLFRSASRDRCRSMLLKVIVQRGNEVLG
jgi:hypothetical protein